MSTTTTTTPNSFGVHAPEPTDRMREAVEHHDTGKTNAEVGTIMGCTGGSAGNLIVNGKRRMGREVNTPGGTGTRAPAVTVPRTRAEIIAAALEQELVKLHTARERVAARVTDATEAVETFDAEAWIAERMEAHDAAVTAAQDARKAFKANAKENAEAHMEALRTVRDALDVTDELAALDAAIDEFTGVPAS